VTTIASTDTLVNELNSAWSVPVEFGHLLHAVRREWFIPDRIWVDRKLSVGHRSLTCGCGLSTLILLS
jgi:hypothetical protein